MPQRLRAIFKSENQGGREREKFLSRVFGIFSEDVVKLWANDGRSPYENLGRPTIKTPDGESYTLDFTLKDRKTGNTYVSEMKCEIEYNNFKYFVLGHSSQLDHHRKPAFEAFLKATRPTADQTVLVKKQSVATEGAILIWGSVSPEARSEIIKARGLHDVLSLEEICADLASWKCERYAELIQQRRKWCDELFTGLLEGGTL
ncbi:hypothetical protein ACSBOB_19990 [Mesorhizobium sp. ASY16-5R]|uniref:hypothetical protein n=1 Tax=Mesorhizobium sp. ASY16-5R TaxID=3445772 RepID=UPI003FA0D8CD